MFLDLGVDGWIGSGVVFGGDNGAINVDRVEGENAFDTSRIVHRMDVAFAGDGFICAMNALDVVPRAVVDMAGCSGSWG